jgi:RNA polymerase sigma-70 factor (ECF subfamily)
MSSPVTDALRRGVAAHPGIELPEPALADYLAERDIDPDGATDEQCAELVLACACARGDRAALAAIDGLIRRAVPAGVAHMKLPADTVDELCQVVRDRLLVGEPAREPRILGYAGRGRLAALIKVIAVRAAISMLRARGREVELSGGRLARLQADELDPELAVMKASYRAAFRHSFASAVTALDSRQRNLLRLHLLGGVTLEALAAIYGVHRATVVRWLARARERLLDETRAAMQAQLELSSGELDSVMALIGSRLDASVQRVLASATEP